MADKTLTERLQPSLLDRLTDDAPGEVQESANHRVIDMRQLREIIQRDLSWLLNSGNKDDLISKEAYPNVFDSVLNYGITDVAGAQSNVHRAARIRDAIQRAIEIFEPRIAPGSLQVQLRKSEKSGETIVSYDIVADMWAQPVPMELYLRSQVDLGTGELSLERLG